MKFSSVKTTIYPDTRHESLNEVNRNLVTEDFAAWAGQIAPRN
jgi:alpha-beta hydrolase superfamily lysophospholipase